MRGHPDALGRHSWWGKRIDGGNSGRSHPPAHDESRPCRGFARRVRRGFDRTGSRLSEVAGNTLGPNQERRAKKQDSSEPPEAVLETLPVRRGVYCNERTEKVFQNCCENVNIR